MAESNIVAGSLRGLVFEKQQSLSAAYKGTKLRCGCRPPVRGSLDTVVEAEGVV